MPINTYNAQLKKVVEAFNLTVAYAASDYDRVQIMAEEVTRPGLQLSGFFDHFEPLRLQVIGNVEYAYLGTLSHERRLEVFDRLFSYKIPALIYTRNLEPPAECMQMAEKYDITILRCCEATTYIVSSLITYLKSALAPRITRHGVLVEIYGEGILLMGESGIGKSEAAAELLKRGHRLIADDAVEIRKLTGNTLMGSSPELIRNYIEIRGIGVINVAKLFGMASIKAETAINMVVNIVPWSNEQVYDRLGLEEQYIDLLGVKIPAITIPIKPGRNLAIILEIAAMNNRQKMMGYNAAAEFTEQINRHFDNHGGQSF
ncbi:MAG: HPr(Ser) kinase/phosphatase [Oscillospiraceae bacterium]|nr:HPr(Ser) kinase/phosphatase [Oscillospiraceae bacterium]